jgi:hypothetical protein
MLPASKLLSMQTNKTTNIYLHVHVSATMQPAMQSRKQSAIIHTANQQVSQRNKQLKN